MLETLALAAVAAVAAVLFLWVPSWLDGRDRADAEGRAAARRAARIVADREVVSGAAPLPPGVSLDVAYRYAAEHDLPLADAAFEIHRQRVTAILRRAFRNPRPGD